MFESSRGISDKPVILPKYVRSSSTAAEAAEAHGAENAQDVSAEQSQHQQTLVTSRQLRGTWASALSSEGPTNLPQETEKKPESPPQNPGASARTSSGGENASVSRLNVQYYGPPAANGSYDSVATDPQSQRESEAHTRTSREEPKTTTDSGVRGELKNVSQNRTTLRNTEPPPEEPPPPPREEPKSEPGAPKSAPAAPKSAATQSTAQTAAAKAQNTAAAAPEEAVAQKGPEPEAAPHPTASPQVTTQRREAETQQKTDQRKQEQTREQTNARNSAVTVQSTFGNPVKTAQVFQAVMHQGLAPPKKQDDNKKTSEPSHQDPHASEGEEQPPSQATGRAPTMPGKPELRDSRRLQASLSGSVGKRDGEEAKPKPGSLAGGWTGDAPTGNKLANGRVVTGNIPIYSPVLDEKFGLQQQEARRLARGEDNLRLGIRQQQGQQLAELAARHAGHTMESLLKKAYRLDERKQLSKQEAVNFLGLVLKLGGDFTFSHSTRVLDLALDLADELGVDEKTREEVEFGALLKDTGEMALLLDEAPPEKLQKMSDWLSSQDLLQAGLLHDIGKTQIPAEILYKPGSLTEEEYELMKLHPILGEQMIYPIQSLRHLCPTIRGHHERWDGKGYPDGLAGEDIPLGARIIAVADVFDALAAERPYKSGMPVEKVRAILAEGRGTHFDPRLADAFERVLQRRYPELENPFD